MRLQEAIQRAREIQDASEGNTIPGDPDHGRWGRMQQQNVPAATPLHHTPPPVDQTAPMLNLPQRPLPPIAVAPDNLNEFVKYRGIPARRVIPPRPL